MIDYSNLQKAFKHLEVQDGTAHDYSGDKAQAALALMEAFLSDATALYQTMSGQPLA